MPTISKKTKTKKITSKPKTTVATKTKTAPIKKKVVKKTVVKKTKKPAPKKANQIVVDIISDEENKFSNSETANRTLEPEKETISPIFSSWSSFEKTEPAENYSSEEEQGAVTDILEEVEAEDNEEYDKQKKFFSDWAQQNTFKESDGKPNLAPQKKSIGLYRRQAFFYLGATLILLLAVAYFFFVKLTIFISPQGEPINDSVSFSVVSDDSIQTASSSDLTTATDKTIIGEFQTKEIAAEKTFFTSEDPVSENTSGPITGTVTLINKYNKNQPLVATTRLLSADGKLYRLKEAVNIPAGGTMTASVYADKAGSDMEVTANTRFSIPGLWAGIQDRIYAENPTTLNYSSKKTIKQSDLDRATKEINEILNIKAKNEKEDPADNAIVYGDAGEGVTEFDVKLGDEKDSFTAMAKKNIATISFPKDKVIELAKARLSLIVSDDKQLTNFNTNQISYSLENFDSAAKTAEIKAHFTGFMSLKSDSSLISQNKLVGLNEKQISEYLNSFPEIKNYRLEFWPSFIKTAPNLPDRINIKIVE